VTTLAELVLLEPEPAHGHPIQIAATSGVWRWVVELADTSAGSYVEWFDITDWYVGDRHQFGADQYMGDARARLVNVQLQIDESDLLAPWGLDTTELFGEDIELDAGLLMRAGLARVAGGLTVEWLPAWTGRVDTWGDASYARGQTRVHEVVVVDTIADLANVPTVITSSNIDWDLWLAENLTEADWQFGQDIYGDLGSAGLPQDLDMVAASTRMDAGTDPIGLVWRSLRSGRLVVHPAPWDTTNTDRYPNPLLDVYPDGLLFSYSPDFTDIEYIADDDQQPFGVQRTAAGIQNWFVVTSGTNIYATDDPVSIGKFGVRPFQASWLIDNDPVVDDLLAARAFASVQALPLRTSVDHEGFFPALAIVDHLDPVTVEHTNAAGRPVVTVVGTIRNVIEERVFRAQDDEGDCTLSWQSTVQIDVTSTTAQDALLPVEDLALVSAFTPGFGGPSGAEFSWTNPTQPTVTPTDVETRIIQRSLIWASETYPGVGADGTTVNWLTGATAYTFQVRLVRRVDGVTTHSSPIRELLFVTPAVILPYPVPDGEDTGGTVGEPPDFDPDDCELEVELQENDGDPDSWVTVDTFTDSELTDNGDGTWSLTTPIPNTFFNEGSMYRFRSREICGTVIGQWYVGTGFDPPDDWTDPCTIPPALATAPFDDANLIVYVPQICAPDIIREAVSGIAGVHGDALAEILALITDPNARALKAVSDPEWSDTAGGIVAYGECPQVIGKTGDKSILARVNVADDTVSCVLFECAAMRLTATAVSGGGWRPGVTVYKVGSTVSLAGGSVLDEDTPYYLAATHDYDTGDIKLYVDAVLDNSVGGTDNVATINALPIWRVGAPPDSWITDCGVFDRVLDPSELPGYSASLYDAIQALGPLSHWPLRETSGTVCDDVGSLNNDTANAATAMLGDATAPDGQPCPVFTGSGTLQGGSAPDNAGYTPGTSSGLTVVFAVKPDTNSGDRVVVSKRDDAGVTATDYEWDVFFNANNLVASTYTSAAGIARRRTTSAPAVDPTLGVWSFVVARFDSSTTGFPTSLRVNGVEAASATSGAGTANGNGGGRLQVGQRHSSSSLYDGQVSQVAIFAGQLSDGDCETMEDAAVAEGWFVRTATAAPVVEATATSSTDTAGTSHTVTLPAGIQSTDLVLICMNIGSTAATMNTLTDWAEVLDENAVGGLKIFYYTGAGVPGNPTFTSSASTRDASISYRISGADKAIVPQIGTTSSAVGTTPDPPSVFPSGGTKNYLFVAFAGAQGEWDIPVDGNWATAAPTGYTPTTPLQKTCGRLGTSLGGLICAASAQLERGGGENPATFTVNTGTTWRAQTICIHPDEP
jgi:hypothetical protein